MDKLKVSLGLGLFVLLIAALFCLVPVVLIWTANVLFASTALGWYITHNFFTYLIVNMVFVYLFGEVTDE